jgi:cystathionine beta-lyase/cystathionine gamma-synthase
MGNSIKTRCIWGSCTGTRHDDTGCISVPLYQSATFAHPSPGESTGFDYSRVSNPTRAALEQLVASLDGADRGFAFSSGMAAITAHRHGAVLLVDNTFLSPYFQQPLSIGADAPPPIVNFTEKRIMKQ